MGRGKGRKGDAPQYSAQGSRGARAPPPPPYYNPQYPSSHTYGDGVYRPMPGPLLPSPFYPPSVHYAPPFEHAPMGGMYGHPGQWPADYRDYNANGPYHFVPHQHYFPPPINYAQPPPASHYHNVDARLSQSSKEEIIRNLEESRLKVEMPCRTLFVRNLGYRADGRKIEAVFSKFGPIKDVANLIDKRGLMFISFYDIRHAENALNELHGSIIETRKLDVHYSLPKQEVDVQAPCTKDHNQGTLLVQVVGATEDVTSSDLERLVKVQGELRRIKDLKHNDLKKYFEFHDSRDCAKAFNTLQGSSFKGGKLIVEFAWDLPETMRMAQASLRGDPLKEGRKSIHQPFREYDRFVPPPKARHHHRSRSPPHHRRLSSPRKEALEQEHGQEQERELVIFEDKVGNPRLRDPRLARQSNAVVENVVNQQSPPDASSGSSALFEQMNSLLCLLNQPKQALPSTSATSTSQGNSDAAAQQLAKLLMKHSEKE